MTKKFHLTAKTGIILGSTFAVTAVAAYLFSPIGGLYADKSKEQTENFKDLNSISRNLANSLQQFARILALESQKFLMNVQIALIQS